MTESRASTLGQPPGTARKSGGSWIRSRLCLSGAGGSCAEATCLAGGRWEWGEVGVAWRREAGEERRATEASAASAGMDIIQTLTWGQRHRLAAMVAAVPRRPLLA